MQNGIAIAGDYMSAASFLGITALVFSNGFDGLLYSLGFLVGWPVILFLIAEKFRNLGKYTFADITAYRLNAKQIRILSAISALSVIVFYLIAQMVGVGQLIEVLFGPPYALAVILVGIFNMLCRIWWNARYNFGSNHKGYISSCWIYFYGIYDFISHKI